MQYSVPDFSGPISGAWGLFIGIVQQFWPFVTGILAIVVGISLVKVIMQRISS